MLYTPATEFNRSIVFLTFTYFYLLTDCNSLPPVGVCSIGMKLLYLACVYGEASQ